MKRIYIPITIVSVLLVYGWLNDSAPLMSDSGDKILERKEKDKVKEKKAKEILTPDQIWKTHNSIIRHDSQESSGAETDVVPQHVLEMEAQAKAAGVWSDSSIGTIDIPPIDPDNPDYEPPNHQLPPTEPELEVVPESLRKLESQYHYIPSDSSTDVPMVGVSEDFLLPNELPPEPAEIEVEPEPLLIEESRYGWAP